MKRILTAASSLQAGMALYKIVPKNPYYFWSVMSLVMQVRTGSCDTFTLRWFHCSGNNTCAVSFGVQAISAQDEKLAQTMFLPLAERMVEKMVKEEKIEAEAEVRNTSADSAPGL